MATGYFLVVGDKTSCGGRIISGSENHSFYNKATARNGDKYICGKDNKIYHFAGGIPNYMIHGVSAAGTLHSRGTCPCKCRFINSRYESSYDFESERKVASTPKPQINNAHTSVAQNREVSLAKVEVTPQFKEKVNSPPAPVDAGFCVLPFGARPASYEPWFFINPPAGTRELYHKLNPDVQKQPGSILIVVDPEKQDKQQIETLQKARDRIDKALEPLTLKEAKLLHDNRGAVDAFSYQLYSKYLGNAGDSLGAISEVGKGYYEEINRILKEIENLYKDAYNRNNGIISGQEFFGRRKILFNKLELILTKFSKSSLDLEEYNDIKKSLGLSTSSIMHKWDRTGVNNIEGYATYIENSSKLIKIMKNVGYVGIGLDFASYTSNIYEACATGRENECRKATINEYSKFTLKQASGITAGGAAGVAARGACMWVLGLATAEVGAIGAGLCLVTGIGTGIIAGKQAEKVGESMGEKPGQGVNKGIDKLKDKSIPTPDSFNEESGLMMYEKLFY